MWGEIMEIRLWYNDDQNCVMVEVDGAYSYRLEDHICWLKEEADRLKCCCLGLP